VNRHVDAVLRDGLVVNGSGGSPVIEDVAIDAGRVVAVGQSLPLAGRREFDCSDLAVLPGFIDVHAHDDLAVLRPDGVEPKIRQGVTSVIIGNCGHGVAPVGDYYDDLRSYSAPVLGNGPSRWPWSTFADYLGAVKAARPPLIVLPLVAHGAARISVMGFAPRVASLRERDRIVTAVRDALNAGAGGVSMGLMYAPACFAGADELIAVAEQAAGFGRVLSVHLRAEGSHIEDALDEIHHVALVSGVKLHISHLKCAGRESHGRMPDVLEALDRWRREGIDVTGDVYPYTAGSTTICGMLPDWLLAGGVQHMLERLAHPDVRASVVETLRQPWPRLENHLLACGPDNITLIGLQRPDNLALEGEPLSKIAEARGTDCEETLVDLVLEEQGTLGIIQHQGREDDLEAAMRWDNTMIGSDGLPIDRGMPHPRLYGTFPRVLGRYSRDRGVLSLQEAARRMTELPAKRFGLEDRGTVTPGAHADLVVLDLDEVTDTATYEAPRSWPKGIYDVWADGRQAWSARPYLCG